MQTDKTRWARTFKHSNTSNIGIEDRGIHNQNDSTVRNIICTSKIPDPPSILAPRRLTRLSKLGKGTYGIVYTGRQDSKIETVKNPSTGNPSHNNSSSHNSSHRATNHSSKSNSNSDSSLPELAVKRNIVEQETTYIGSVKELDLFHQEMYKLYHYHMPNYELGNIRSTVSAMLEKIPPLKAVQLPARLQDRQEKFETSAAELEKEVNNLAEIVKNDNRKTIEAAVEELHTAYQGVAAIFD